MAQIELLLEKQLLTIQNQEIISSGDMSYDTCGFSFDGSWDGYVKTGVFYQDKGNVQYAVLGADGTCTVPAQAMAKEGNMYIGVFGISGSKVLTSTLERVYIRQGAISGGTVSTEPGDDVFLAIIAQYQGIAALMQGYDAKMEAFIKAMAALNAYDVVDVMERLGKVEGSVMGMGASIGAAVQGGLSEATGGLRFGQDGDGGWGYIPPGTMAVIPFGKGGTSQGGEIGSADWVQVRSGIHGDFIRAVYKDGCLAAVTADGSIAYTLDGAEWKSHKLEYPDCRITDIDWDGERFLLTGSHMGADAGAGAHGMILATEDFAEYDEVTVENSDDSGTEYDIEYCAVYPINGKYIVIARRKTESYTPFFWYIGDLKSGWTYKSHIPVSSTNITPPNNYGESHDSVDAAVSKSTTDMFLRLQYRAKTNYYDAIYRLRCNIYGDEGQSISQVHNSPGNVFECKDTLFYCSLSATNGKLARLDSDKVVTVSEGMGFALVDGTYFRGDEVFITAHDMLMVKRGESLAEKTAGDLVEIAPEYTMNCITKAFGGLFIFGNRGVILKPA